MSNLKTFQECFSKKQSKINLENQLADIHKKKHQAFINHNAINVNDSFIYLKVRDNINIIPESTEIITKNDSKNANTKYKKIKKKIVSSPLKLGGFLVFEIWTKRGVMKKLLRNRGLVEREDTLRKGSFQIVSSVFLKKSMFSLLLEFLSGKYSHLL